ncbi:ATPase family AAA domain-containing protein 2B [Nymphon striatum]|nr:ATPase family AAA domain-containing protein 2B [Nymphon striatum]
MVMTRRAGDNGPGMFGKELKRSSRSRKEIIQNTDGSESDVIPTKSVREANNCESPVATRKKRGGLNVTLTDSEESHTYTSRSGRRVISNKLFNDFDSTKYFKKSKSSSQQELNINSIRNKEKCEHSVISMENDNFDSSKSADITESPRYKVRRSGRSVEAKANHVPVNGELSYLDDDSNRRRSSRTRKSLYGTLNQSMLLGTASFRSSREHRSSATYDDDAIKDDMYSIVKGRHLNRRNAYPEEKSPDLSNEDDGESGNLSSSSDENEEIDNAQSKYHLRPKKPSIDRFQHSVTSRKKRKSIFNHTESPARIAFPRSYRKSMLRSPLLKNRRHATHNSSSTSSSSDDEMRFERRKAKSMVHARNRFLPMNLTAEDVAHGTIRDRVKIGSSLADVDPMALDKSVTFDKVGGVNHHIQSLKEMVLLPIMYPEVFEQFQVSPPKGVLFYGPPGTGKTLLARALANECSNDNQKVSFFMRKGADCLSKWVGESERQLRLLFDQAYAMRPSIIFFDEIDGLAPVRSSRQDQIHSSIVSTLLALMDGLDNRGEVVVIGATNRIDAIDPALRRPGRFDREFHFPLPTSMCVGYCGADIKALCSEAILSALRKRYPQIYSSRHKLVLNVSSVQVSAVDFDLAMQKIVPAGSRAIPSCGRPLPSFLGPLLKSVFNEVLVNLQSIFPQGINSHCSADVQPTLESNVRTPASNGSDSSWASSKVTQNDISNSLSHYNCYVEGIQHLAEAFKRLLNKEFFMEKGVKPYAPDLAILAKLKVNKECYRPRLLLCGTESQGQSAYLGPAILYHYDGLPVHCLDLPSLFSESSASPEESCARIFREAKRNTPSIIYLPHIDTWWSTVNSAVVAIFLSLLNDMSSSTPVLLIATSDAPLSRLDNNISKLFSPFRQEVLHMKNPSANQRKEFFAEILLKQALIKPLTLSENTDVGIEELEIAPPPEPRKLSESEMKKLERQDENTLRELRIFLREVINKLVRIRKFAMFVKPVDMEEVPDYHKVITQPMNFQTMMQKIDFHEYETAQQFVEDIQLIRANALEYNPAKGHYGSYYDIRNRACALLDCAVSIIETEMDPEFDKMCRDIHEKRLKRGQDSSKSAPRHYHTVPEPEPENDELQQISISDNEFNKNHPNSCNGMKEKRVFTRSRRTPWFGSRRRKRVLKKNISVTEEKNCTNEKMDAEEEGSKEKSSNEEEKAKLSSSASQGSSPTNHNARKNNETLKVVSNTSPNVLVNGCSDNDDNETTEKEVIVDTNRLKELLNMTVECTKNVSLDKLESLYRTLQLSVTKHSCNYNKFTLIQQRALLMTGFSDKESTVLECQKKEGIEGRRSCGDGVGGGFRHRPSKQGGKEVDRKELLENN